MIEPADCTDLLGRWWFNYDEGNFDVLADLLTEDVHFTCRTDTDTRGVGGVRPGRHVAAATT